MNLIAYFRVSTRRQGESGLGLDAQRSAAQAHALTCNGTILAEFTEVESGKRSDRPKLAKALEQAKLTGATLIVAKLDRLGRNVAFLSALMESGVPFVACDNPHANRLTLHVLAAVAEAEAVAISARTKSALAQAKKRGVLLGGANPKCRNLDEASRARGQARGGAVMKRKAMEFKSAMGPIAKEIDGTADVVAEELNRRGYRTRRGLAWNQNSVKQLLEG